MPACSIGWAWGKAIENSPLLSVFLTLVSGNVTKESWFGLRANLAQLIGGREVLVD